MDWGRAMIFDIVHSHVLSGLPCDPSGYDRQFIYQLVADQANLCKRCGCELACGYGIDRRLHPRGMRISRTDPTLRHSFVNSYLVCSMCLGVEQPSVDLRVAPKKKQKKSKVISE